MRAERTCGAVASRPLEVEIGSSKSLFLDPRAKTAGFAGRTESAPIGKVDIECVRAEPSVTTVRRSRHRPAKLKSFRFGAGEFLCVNVTGIGMNSIGSILP